MADCDDSQTGQEESTQNNKRKKRRKKNSEQKANMKERWRDACNSSVATAQAEHKVKRALLLDVVVRQRAPVLKLLACKDEPLLVRRDALLVLDLRLDVLNRVRRLNLKRDGLARQRLHKDLHGVGLVLVGLFAAGEKEKKRGWLGLAGLFGEMVGLENEVVDGVPATKETQTNHKKRLCVAGVPLFCCSFGFFWLFLFVFVLCPRQRSTIPPSLRVTFPTHLQKSGAYQRKLSLVLFLADTRMSSARAESAGIFPNQPEAMFTWYRFVCRVSLPVFSFCFVVVVFFFFFLLGGHGGDEAFVRPCGKRQEPRVPLLLRNVVAPHE